MSATKATCRECGHHAVQHIPDTSPGMRQGNPKVVDWLWPCGVPGCACKNHIPEAWS